MSAKVFKTIEEQIDILKSKGLIVEDYDKAKAYAEELLGGRRPSRAEYYEGCDETVFAKARYLWKEERARLQTVPEDYVESLTELEAADMLGDGWTVDVIAGIFTGCV